MQTLGAVSQIELAIIVPGHNPREERGEEQRGTAGNEQPVIHHHRSADTPQGASDSSDHQPALSSGHSDADQQSREGCIQMVS